MRKSQVLAWGVVVSVFLLGGVSLWIEAGLESNASPTVLNIVFATATALLAVSGLLLVRRVPGNPIAWLLIGEAASLALSAIAYDWAAYSLEHGGSQPLAQVAAAWDTHGWPSIFAPLVALLFVFPDGRLMPGKLWRRTAIWGTVAFVASTVGGFLGSEALDPPFDDSIEPLAVLPDGLASMLQGLGLLGLLATFVLAALSVRSRYKRADFTERSQLKWLLYASALAPLAIISGTVDGLVFDGDGLLTLIPFLAVVIAVPGAVLVAVTRYRLYDIDRLISATVLYVVMTLVLAGAFAGIILVGGVALGGGSPVTTAVATAAVTLAFRPLRRALQERVDRRFNRARYDALHQVDEFLERLRAGDTEPEMIEEVLKEALRDPELRVYFWLSDQEGFADAEGRGAEIPAGVAQTPVRRGELMLGAVTHGAPVGEGTSIDEVIARAGLAIEVARLRVEVRRQLAEVEASRARIASATHEERRRLERDLHDGAQQRLVSIGLDLRHLQQGLGADDEARSELDQAVGGLTEAIAELRELARGVRPGMLDEGLARALGDLAARSALDTEVDATGDRFPDELEAAAYFVASEALTNAAKHSGASSVRVRVARENGSLLLTVSDNGSGGASTAAGSGLTGLADRAAAIGGRFEITSPPGRGTELRAEFPCA